MFTGKGTVDLTLNTLRTKTPFFNSENYRRLPEDSLFPGIVRELANLTVKNIPGIFMNTFVTNLDFFILSKQFLATQRLG